MLLEVESADGEESEIFHSFGLSQSQQFLHPFTTSAVISVGCLETEARLCIIWVNLALARSSPTDLRY